MTMHLLRGASSLNIRKPKVKLTKSKLAQLETEWRAHNRRMKQSGNHDLRYNKLEDYIKYTFGQNKVNKEFKPYESNPSYRRTTENIPSASLSPSNAAAGQNATARKEPQRYTGTLIKGISTMHKSNAVPIMNAQEAKEHASMRR